MTISAGTDATKTSAINEFVANVTNAANSGVAFSQSYNPLSVNGLGAYTAPYLSDAYVTAPTEGNIPESDMIASTVNSILRYYAYLASRVRLVQYYYNDNGSLLDYGIGKTLGNDALLASSSFFDANGNQPDAGTPASGSELTTFIAQLAAIRSSVESSVVTITACHSSCHSSCHGSRGRR